jgi:serine/threonine-protein kinase
MGRVYDAIDEDSGTAVAVKLVEPTLLNTDADRALYRQEARACAAIRDPRVVRVLAYGEWHDARPGRGTTAWLAMERLHGRTLQRVLAGGPLPLGVACHVMSELCLALAAVDEAGLVHRDVKPGNIMVLATGAVKLMDFGAALSADAAGPRVVLGTPGYLAPEQALGAPPVAASDLFAAGVVAYEMLAGRRPFAARGLDGYLAALATPPPPLPPHTPPELARAVAACLAHDPGSRPARPRELAATFAVHATRPPPTPESPAPVVRSEAGAFALWRLWSSYRSREPDATVEGFARWVVAQSTPPAPLARPVETWLADPVPPVGGDTVPPEEEA